MKLTARLPLLLVLALAILSLCLSASSASDWDTERERGGQSAGRQGEEGEGRYSSSGRPYHYGEESFKHRTTTRHGRFRVLERFTHELLRDSPVGDRRVAVLEAAPRAFLQPSHYDADEVFYVREGEGVVVMLWKGKRQSLCVREGDVMVIPAGATVYAANTHDSRWFRVVMLLNPVSTPGRFGEFFPVGGERQESFFGAFSDDILQAAFNARKEELEKVFEERSEGEITQAPEEQIRALSKSCSSSRGSGSGSRSEQDFKPTSISSKEPRFSNNHGRLSEITGEECPHLRRLDMEVGLANITRGSMMAMSYSTRATKIAVVVEGNGYFEMACPHMSGSSSRRSERRRELEQGSEGRREREREREQEHGSEEERRERQEREHEQSSEEERRREREQGQGQKSRGYRQVGANIKEGSVIVLPAAHPATFVAGGEGNLAVLCFGVGAERDEKVFLTGKSSPLRQLVEEDEAARKLVFGERAQEAEKVVRGQTDDVFVRGPRQRQSGVSDM